MKKILDNGHIMHYNNHCSAGVAHLVERDLAKVEVASSSLVARSKITPSDRAVFFFCIYRPGRGSNRARAKREKHAGGMFWCPRACGGPAGPPASLVARSKITPSDRAVFFFCIYRPGRGSNRARAKREKHAGGMFWCPRACGGPAGPPASLVARSKKLHHPNRVVFFCIYRAGRGSNRARAKREKHAGGMFWCPRACGGPAGPPASLVARSKKKHHPNRMVFLCICRAAGDVLTVMQAAQKRRISTTLLFCSEDGVRERYSIICCTFFCLQPLCRWLHRR